MKFLEISLTATVNIDQISWIEKLDGGLSCIVCVGEKEYPCDIPYNSLLNMLKQSEAGHDNFHFAG
jgi:hypothetical protein